MSSRALGQEESSECLQQPVFYFQVRRPHLPAGPEARVHQEGEAEDRLVHI